MTNKIFIFDNGLPKIAPKEIARVTVGDVKVYVGISRTETYVTLFTKNKKLVREILYVLIGGRGNPSSQHTNIKTDLYSIMRTGADLERWEMCFNFCSSTVRDANLELQRISRIAESLSKLSEIKLIKQ